MAGSHTLLFEHKGSDLQETNVSRLLISAPHKSAGKTTVSMGILNNLLQEGGSVQSFKKGPDYIDPMWLKLASGTECYNLDPYLMGAEVCLDSFVRHGTKSGVALIEGNHGLHDGMSLDGFDSSAGLANMLQTPVLLVINSRGIGRGAAAVVTGMQKMQPEPNIVGVILNQVRSARQQEKQKAAIERFCGIPVVGSIPIDEAVTIPERHLGLTTVDEMETARGIISRAGELVARHCDMGAIKSMFKGIQLNTDFQDRKPLLPIHASVKIGIFHDPTFCFYYPENLEALRENGAELVFIDSLCDNSLPDLDGLYIGGGFPESFFEELSANRKMLLEVKERVRSGLPVYAECGGLIYLCETAYFKGKKYPLAGVLPFEIGYQRNPVGYGYLSLKSRCQSRWFDEGALVKAHEFHYSKPLRASVTKPSLSTTTSTDRYQFNVIRGYGIDGKQDGILHKNIFASFAHLHAVVNPQWARGFVELATEYQC